MKKLNNIKNWLIDNKFIVFLFLFSFVIRIIAVVVLKTDIVSDFKVMYDASLEIINGTDQYKEMSYFITWGYQMGHVLYQALLLKIFNSVIFLKIVNSLVTALTVVFVYLIGKSICSERSARIASVLYSVFLFPVLLNAVLTNQLLPMLLILIAVYYLLKIDYKKKFIKTSIIVGCLLGLSNILRSEVIVILFSILLYYVFLFFTKVKFKNLVVS